MATFNQLAEDFLAQKRIAIAGVSRTRQDAANLIYKALRKRGYQVFPINPNAEMLEGDQAYASVADIPGGVDGILVVTKPEISEKIVVESVAAGVPRVWMHNNTFAPSSVSPTAVAHCRQHKVAVIDGGCPLMFLDFGHKCMKWVLGMMGRLPAETPTAAST